MEEMENKQIPKILFSYNPTSKEDQGEEQFCLQL
jgi:hypothetical protein